MERPRCKSPAQTSGVVASRTSRLAGCARLACSLAFGFSTLLGCGHAEPAPLTVFAASSLTDVFQAFATRAPARGGRVRFSFAGSHILRLQLEEGADADVFASADARHMAALVDAGKVVSPRTFAHNEVVLAVPRSNPAAIERFVDLPRARRIVVGDPHVPIGRYTRALLDKCEQRFGPGFRRAVLEAVVSEESSVRLVRSKVELEEADAAFVYRSDAASARIRVVEVPSAVATRAAYLIGLVASSRHKPEARRFIAWTLSEAGRAALRKGGWETAPTP